MENPTQVALNSKRQLIDWGKWTSQRKIWLQTGFDASYTDIFHLSSPNFSFLLQYKNDSPYDAKWLLGACRSPILPPARQQEPSMTFPRAISDRGKILFSLLTNRSLISLAQSVSDALNNQSGFLESVDCFKPIRAHPWRWGWSCLCKKGVIPS